MHVVQKVRSSNIFWTIHTLRHVITQGCSAADSGLLREVKPAAHVSADRTLSSKPSTPSASLYFFWKDSVKSTFKFSTLPDHNKSATMASQEPQVTEGSAQPKTKSMEIRPKKSSETNNDKMDTSEREATSESSEEESSSEDSDASTSDNEDEIATVTMGQKPDFTARVASGAPSLEDRLKAFLPQLAEANDKLEKDGAKGHSMEDVKDDEPHIEMSLGLGLLEEKSGKDGEQDDEEEDSSEDEDEDGAEKNRKEKDVMGKLMGGRENQAAGIEEVG